MSEQHRLAAAKSARVRTTRRLVRELSKTKPLTLEQRAQIVEAASTMAVLPPQ